jgi:hypothetical protein
VAVNLPAFVHNVVECKLFHPSGSIVVLALIAAMVLSLTSSVSDAPSRVVAVPPLRPQSWAAAWLRKSVALLTCADDV